ncbi:TPA: hypothetical protein DCW56_05265 [Candidatus Peregrinibacteria bacterium]|nr:MAG: hypothetical protein UW03_C0003G0018 [Candidatus Peregrinibacteria bacterium GW2011_GWA2_43_8]HAU40312.1 hypothetical protein [Candidatus Peregrinibacteria bacterium]
MLKIILKLADLDVAELYGDELLDYYFLPSNLFLDMNDRAWYAPDVTYSYMQGIVPEQQVTLGEMAKILVLVGRLW